MTVAPFPFVGGRDPLSRRSRPTALHRLRLAARAVVLSRVAARRFLVLVLLSYAERRGHPDCPRSVPWELLAPHESRARTNHGGQSLATLANRGGLSPSEMMAVLEDRPWRSMSLADAIAQLTEALARTARRAVEGR